MQEKMKTYAIVLIVCGSVIAVFLTLWCLCNSGRKREGTQRPAAVTRTAPNRSIQMPQAGNDVEKGQSTTSNVKRDGGMVMLVGLGAAVATTTVVASTTGGCGGGGDTGGGDGGGCGGGGGGCGGCGGCGG